ncbi:hypothetical protein BJX70DRAFT_397741 [Aspergillus crustosus]
MALSNGAIIAIVIAACLAVTTIGAALFRQYNPAEPTGGLRNFSREQEIYMRSVRLKNMGFNVRESRQGNMMGTGTPVSYSHGYSDDNGNGGYENGHGGRDLESAAMTADDSSRY